MEHAFLPTADSLLAGGSVTAPGANGAVATSAVPPAGKYRVIVRYALSGTAETLLSNLAIAVNGADITSSLPTISGSGWNEIRFYYTANGSNAIIVRAHSAATAGAVYSAAISASQVATS